MEDVIKEKTLFYIFCQFLGFPLELLVLLNAAKAKKKKSLIAAQTCREVIY